MGRLTIDAKLLRSLRAHWLAATIFALSVIMLVAATSRGYRLLTRKPWATFSAPLPGESKAPRLLFVLRPADCRQYIGVTHHWGELHRLGKARVLGVVIDPPPGTEQEFRQRWKLSFPVVFDHNSRVERMILVMGYDRTPITIIVDSAGRPRAVLLAAASPAEQVLARRIIELHANLLLAGN